MLFMWYCSSQLRALTAQEVRNCQPERVLAECYLVDDTFRLKVTKAFVFQYPVHDLCYSKLKC